MWDIERTVDELRAAAHEAGMVVFTGFPSDVPLARWTGDDPTTFVDLGARAGAPVLYVSCLTTEQHAAAEGLSFEDVAEGRDVPDDSALVMVVSAWAAGPVVHTMTITDPHWQRALDDAIVDADVARLRADIDRREREELVEVYARQVVSDSAFHDHGSVDRTAKQVAAVRRLLPDVDEDLAWRIADRADRIDKLEFKAAREADQAARARRLLENGRTKRDAATELGISVNVLNRVLQTNPPAR